MAVVVGVEDATDDSHQWSVKSNDNTRASGCSSEARAMRPDWWSFTSHRRPVLDLLCAVYGLSSWLAITGIWMELPVLVHVLPEGWALSSSLTLTIQLANVSTVVYGLTRICFNGPQSLTVANHTMMAIGTVACVVLVFNWKRTVVIAGKDVSLVLMVAAFSLSIVDCISSVVYLPFVGRFKEVYMTSFLIGEGLGGLVPSLVALAQGLDDPRCVNRTVVDPVNGSVRIETVLEVGATHFGPELFFAVLLLLMVVSWAAFVLLNECHTFQSEWRDEYRATRFGPGILQVALHTIPIEEPPEEKPDEVAMTQQRPRMRKWRYVALLLTQGWSSLLSFGFLPSLQSYSCLPYGSGVLHLSVTLCGIAYPASCIAAMFVTLRKPAHLNLMTLVGTLLSAYITVTAVMSPSPPLVDTTVGSALIVSCWVCAFLLLSYVRTVLTVLMAAQGETALFWVGAATQLGAVLGSVALYVPINHFGVFVERSTC